MRRVTPPELAHRQVTEARPGHSMALPPRVKPRKLRRDASRTVCVRANTVSMPDPRSHPRTCFNRPGYHGEVPFYGANPINPRESRYSCSARMTRFAVFMWASFGRWAMQLVHHSPRHTPSRSDRGNSERKGNDASMPKCKSIPVELLATALCTYVVILKGDTRAIRARSKYPGTRRAGVAAPPSSGAAREPSSQR